MLLKYGYDDIDEIFYVDFLINLMILVILEINLLIV